MSLDINRCQDSSFVSLKKECCCRLLAAFEYIVLKKNGKTRACRDGAAFWELVDVHAYPYSGALSMLGESTTRINKYHVICDVYVDSLVKWKLAAEGVIGLYRVGRMG